MTDVTAPQDASAEPVSRYATLPAHIPLAETITGQEPDPFDPAQGRDLETDYLLRVTIPWALG